MIFVQKPSTFVRFLGYVKPYTNAVVLASTGGVVKFTVPLFVPQLTRYLIDHVFRNSALPASAKFKSLLFLIGVMVAVYLFVWTPFTYVRHSFAGKAGHRSVFDLRSDLYFHILRMSSSFFNANRSGAIVSRLMNDTSQAQNLVGSALTNVWIDGTSIFVILYFLLSIDVPTALVALVTFPIYIVFFKRIGGKIKSTSYELQKSFDTMAGDVQEKVSGSTVVQAFTREQHEERAFHAKSERLFSTTMHNVFLQSLNMAVSGLITGLAPLLVLIFGGYRLIHGDMTIGGLVAVTMYLGPLYLPLQRFSELNVIFSTSTAALERIFEVMDMEPEIRDSPHAISPAAITGDIVFERVSFAYAQGLPVLKEVSFQAHAGQKVALVGRSGSGKSTIVSLIPRFYDVTSGCIRIDGTDIRNLLLQTLRHHIGIVLQDPVLFSGTIRDNICYGKPAASEREIIEACKMANAWEFISAMEGRLDTEIGERGVLLSGGQKQRLTIARAFLKDPRILIFDEATSALDSESESLIQEAIERLMVGRTTFIIAHRLSTISSADLILVVKRGEIAEAGRHEELLAGSGVYRSLYDFQFAHIAAPSRHEARS